ncbi:T9SS type A sorting domain-containing protein [uncultured Tenacibaculum sp.]|uniref:T9SS type A sorting domain-containing protein n=1 Tax=uncultured Tenacibaculum sp. TaxID=174713 RepID=UPI00344212DB
MIRKLLFILCITCVVSVFSQQKSVNKLVASQNRYNSITNISFNSTNKQQVIISVKNVLGKNVFLKKVMAHKGKNTIRFDRNKLKSGIYIYAIQTNNTIISKRFVLK